ncbi:MAG: hypothetical protein WCI80_05350, partial [Bacteroidota bacterium]
MREKEKKKANPFLVFTFILLVIIVTIFIIRISLFTPKETTVVIDKYVPNSDLKTNKDSSNFTSNSSEDKNQNYRKNWKDYISIAPLHKDVDYIIAADG